MTPDLAHLLPCPGPVWGSYPLRPAHDTTPPRRAPHLGATNARLRRIAADAGRHECHWQPRDLGALRALLRRDGLVDAHIARALGVVSVVATHVLGWTPRPGQRFAAAALLDGRLAEMATGEGKTLAVALAAGVAALAGIPVHVVTANPYLAARDAARLQPFFSALGLRATALREGETDAERRAAYAHDVVYATAKELAFDFLRDRQATQDAGPAGRVARELALAQAAPPLMRGLCMALLDEADSILLDEADVPLILSRAAPHAARRAFLWQALAVARRLVRDADFELHGGHGEEADLVVLTAAGEERLAALAPALGGPWLRPRYRREVVTIALAALHVYRRDEHYIVRDGRVELLDAVTGRVADGRVWGRGLHTVVALKENASPPPETDTVAQTSFQRFFQRYWRLCGLSGTLREARAEMRAVYGLPVVRVAPHRASRCRGLPPRRFADAASLHAAVVARAFEMRAAGRPILIGTDSVAASLEISAALAAHGIAHEVLNALNDAAEAAIVARAGTAGRVTVATRMAGRGTDIVLDDTARAAGGLHVLSCQDNPSGRLDRQLAGRAARGGDPGSTEAWRLAGPGSGLGSGHRPDPRPDPSDEHANVDTPASKAGEIRTSAQTAGLGSGHGPDPSDEHANVDSPASKAGEIRTSAQAARGGALAASASEGAADIDRPLVPTDAGCPPSPITLALDRLAHLRHRLAQGREEARRAAARAQLMRQELQWEQRLAFAGPSD